jgi:hypothetical protein
LGQNAPIIIVTAIANDSFVVPPDARLSDAWGASFKAVDIYFAYLRRTP